MLEKADATVLCGHLHMAAMIEYEGANGTFRQLAENSVMRSAEPRFRNVLEGAGHYTPELAESKRSTGAQLEHRKRLFAGGRPRSQALFPGRQRGLPAAEGIRGPGGRRVLQRNERGSGQSDPGALK